MFEKPYRGASYYAIDCEFSVGELTTYIKQNTFKQKHVYIKKGCPLIYRNVEIHRLHFSFSYNFIKYNDHER